MLKIKIKITLTDDEELHHEVMEAHSVIDAEGKLAIMARHYQKVYLEHRGEHIKEKVPF